MAKTVGEWIEHDGKGMPVDGNTRVHVKIGGHMDDVNLDPELASWWHGEHPEESNWIDDGDPWSTITHYRIVKENQDA